MNTKSMNYAYTYAKIDIATNMCIGVQSRTLEIPADELPSNWVELPVNDPEYFAKYYNWDDGKFYYDAEYTQEYISPLL